MKRVQVRPIGRSIRGVPPGGTVGVSRRDARLLVKIGRAEYADDAPAPKKAAPKKAAGFADMDYNDLRSLAADLPEDQKPKSQKKKDLIAALEAAG